MKRKTTRKQKFLWFLTKHMKPCYWFSVTKTPKGDYLHCGYNGSRRKRCGTYNCPHFAPTTWYKIARWLGMVKR